MEKFAERLKTRLRETQITHRELADRMGIHSSNVAHYTSGRTKPTEERIKKLAEVLECDVNWLKGIDDEVNNNDIKRNAEGYYDPTAYNAIKNTFDAKVDFRRGEIYYVKNGYYKDHSGTEIISPGRPAVIVSNDRLNAVLKHVEVVYLTSKNERQNDHNVAVMCRCPSTALCAEVNTVNKDRLNEYVRTCTIEEMAAIDKALMVGFGIAAVSDSEEVAELNESVKTLIDDKNSLEAELEELNRNFEMLKTNNRLLRQDVETLEAKNATLEKLSANKTVQEQNPAEVIVLTTQRDFYKQQYEMLLNKLIGR